MYFPYLRGRQFELIALRELVEKETLGDKIIPVIEPVKLSSSLIKTIQMYTDKGKTLAIIVNPRVGNFISAYIRKPYKAGSIFYRCRLSTEDGISAGDMGAPPIEKTKEGRVNAMGIRCLYLGDTAETTIYEVRAGAYDYVTVGKFELLEDIIVVDLKKINQISPFIEGLDCLEYAINKEHLNKINNEMGKIMRRSDSILDYIPTQYISDFIKSIVHDGVSEYAGVEYNSVMHSGGFNVAIFNPDLFRCIETDVYRIDTIDYRKHMVE